MSEGRWPKRVASAGTAVLISESKGFPVDRDSLEPSVLAWLEKAPVPDPHPQCGMSIRKATA